MRKRVVGEKKRPGVEKKKRVQLHFRKSNQSLTPLYWSRILPRPFSVTARSLLSQSTTKGGRNNFPSGAFKPLNFSESMLCKSLRRSLPLVNSGKAVLSASLQNGCVWRASLKNSNCSGVGGSVVGSMTYLNSPALAASGDLATLALSFCKRESESLLAGLWLLQATTIV